MTRPKPETSLVKSCLAYLHAKGVMAWRNLLLNATMEVLKCALVK